MNQQLDLSKFSQSVLFISIYQINSINHFKIIID
jgi:hypothetical protein